MLGCNRKSITMAKIRREKLSLLLYYSALTSNFVARHSHGEKYGLLPVIRLDQ